MQEMTHTQIEEEDLVHLYVANQLNEATVEAFEHHFMTCAQCTDAIKMEETLRKAYSTIAPNIPPPPEPEDVPDPQEPSGTPTNPGYRRWLTPLIAVAAAVMFFIAIPDGPPEPQVFELLATTRAEAEQTLVLPKNEKRAVLLKVPINTTHFRLLLHDEEGNEVGSKRGTQNEGEAHWTLSKRLEPGVYRLTVDISDDGKNFEFDAEYPFLVKPPE